MSTARFLLALACSCTSAGVALAGGSAAELELELARGPDLYLRLDLASDVLQVMVRGIELDRIDVRAVRLVSERAPGGRPVDPIATLPAVWRIASAPELEWRKVVAPPTLVPYQEDSAAPTPGPTATPSPAAPAQYRVELDGGWTLHLGPDPPMGFWQRLWRRASTGWQRLVGHPAATSEPAITITTSAEDSRRLLHVLRPGTALLVRCGGPGAGSVDASGAAPTRAAATG